MKYCYYNYKKGHNACDEVGINDMSFMVTTKPSVKFYCYFWKHKDENKKAKFVATRWDNKRCKAPKWCPLKKSNDGSI